MRLVEEGKIGLDRPIDTYVKRWHLPPSSFDNSQVTVRRLLSHTSGISAHDYHGWDPASPLPMSHTQYGLPSDYPTTMATPYDALERPLPILRYNESAAAGLTTNLNDLCIFAAAGVKASARALPGRGVLKAASVEAMESPTPA